MKKGKDKSLQKWRSLTSYVYLLIFYSLLTSCNGQYQAVTSHETPHHTTDQDTASQENKPETNYVNPMLDLNFDDQLMLVIRRVFQDSRKNIWIVGDDVYCYNGDTLMNLSHHEVLSRTAVRQIKEDGAGNIWLGGSDGLIRYTPPKGKELGMGQFTQYTHEEGLIDNDIWSLFFKQSYKKNI